MSKSQKESKTIGCFVIIVLLGISRGIPSLIRGEGFLNGITGNIEAGFYLFIIALIGYAIYKLFLEK